MPRVPRKASGIHQNREFHIFHACSVVPSVCCDPSESVPRELHACSVVPSVCYDPFARALCLQGPWDPSESRVPCLPRVLYGVQRLLRPFRIASSMSPTRALWCPAFVATPQICEFHICCACSMVPSVRCDPSDLRVPHLLRVFYGAPRLLRPFRFHICCACFMVPRVCCDPSDLRVPHVPRNGRAAAGSRQQQGSSGAAAGSDSRAAAGGNSSATSTKGGE